MLALRMTLVLLPLACAPPSADAYAIGVANLLERTLSDAAARVRQGAENPEQTWEDALTYEGRIARPGAFDSLFAPWVGDLDLRLAPRDDAPTTWDLTLDGEDVRVRRFVANCSDWSCDMPDPALHGGCAIDWDPPDYTFSAALEGTLEFTEDPPAERENGEDAYAWFPSSSFALVARGVVDGAIAEVVATYEEHDAYSTFLSVQLTLNDVRAAEVQCGNSD